MFASYHIYQGTTGIISAATTGLVYALAFCWMRRYGRFVLRTRFGTSWRLEAVLVD